MYIAQLKHLQKVKFNTKGHLSTLNYDPSSGINFQRGHFFMRGGVVIKQGESLFNVENRPSIRLKIDPGSHFSTGSLFNVTPAKRMVSSAYNNANNLIYMQFILHHFCYII